MRILNLLSTFKHYDDEESGIKPYTIRIRTKRLEKLSKDVTHLKMQRAYTKSHFIRKITHTLDWDKYSIFAWNSNERPLYSKKVTLWCSEHGDQEGNVCKKCLSANSNITPKELKRRRKELLEHPERGIKLKDLDTNNSKKEKEESE